MAVQISKKQAGNGPSRRPYLRLKMIRKPLFPQLDFPVSRIVPKNVKGGTLWDFLNIDSVAKYQKLMGGGTIKKISEKNEKCEQSHSAEKKGKVS